MNIAKIEKYILDGYEKYEYKKERTVKEYLLSGMFRQCFGAVVLFAVAFAILSYIRHNIYALLLLALVISITIIRSAKSHKRELNAIDERAEKSTNDTGKDKSDIPAGFEFAILAVFILTNDFNMVYASGSAGTLAAFGVWFLGIACGFIYRFYLMRKYCPHLADYGGKNIEWPDEDGAEDK